MTIYISLPCTGKYIEGQRRAASDAAAAIRRLGHTPISPFIIKAPLGLTPYQKHAYFLGEGLKLLLQCQGILLPNDWENSRVCTLEATAAKNYNLQCFTSPTQIPQNQ